MLNWARHFLGGALTQMSVGDFDGDGKAEFACRPRRGTKDGNRRLLSTGNRQLADSSKDYRNGSGYISDWARVAHVFGRRHGKNSRRWNYPVLETTTQPAAM